MSTIPHQTKPNHDFECDARSALEALRPALASVLAELKQPIGRASELQRTLKLDKKLSWSLFSAATTLDSRALASLLPGRRAMERFFTAAAAHGVPESTIENAREAFAAVQRTMTRHAPRREAFERMVAEIAVGEDDEAGHAIDARHKRAAFRSQALLWGREARLTCAPVFIHPSQNTDGPRLVDRAMVSGIVDLQRIRRGVALHKLVRLRRTPATGDPDVDISFEPLDPTFGGCPTQTLGLLRDFCSRPLPEFEPVPTPDGHLDYRLLGRGVGAAAKVTFYVGHILRRADAAPGSVPGAELAAAKVIDLPTELFIRDVFMHKSLWDQQPPEVRIYACPTDGAMHSYREDDLLPLKETATYLGTGLDAASTPDIPRYAELLRFITRRTGWNPGDFQVFRCRVEYPLLYTRVHMRFASSSDPKTTGGAA